MTQKRFLQYSLCLMLAIASITIVRVLIQASADSPEPREDWAVFDLSSIATGEFRLLDCACEPAGKILLINDHDGQLYSYLLPQQAGKTLLPDEHNKWRGPSLCSKLAPQSTTLGKLQHNARILCHDEDKSSWQWQLNGKPLQPAHAPMIKLQTERKGQYLHIFQ